MKVAVSSSSAIRIQASAGSTSRLSTTCRAPGSTVSPNERTSSAPKVDRSCAQSVLLDSLTQLDRRWHRAARRFVGVGHEHVPLAGAGRDDGDPVWFPQLDLAEDRDRLERRQPERLNAPVVALDHQTEIAGDRDAVRSPERAEALAFRAHAAERGPGGGVEHDQLVPFLRRRDQPDRAVLGLPRRQRVEVGRREALALPRLRDHRRRRRRDARASPGPLGARRSPRARGSHAPAKTSFLVRSEVHLDADRAPPTVVLLLDRPIDAALVDAVGLVGQVDRARGRAAASR